MTEYKYFYIFTHPCRTSKTGQNKRPYPPNGDSFASEGVITSRLSILRLTDSNRFAHSFETSADGVEVILYPLTGHLSAVPVFICTRCFRLYDKVLGNIASKNLDVS